MPGYMLLTFCSVSGGRNLHGYIIFLSVGLVYGFVRIWLSLIWISMSKNGSGVYSSSVNLMVLWMVFALSKLLLMLSRRVSIINIISSMNLFQRWICGNSSRIFSSISAMKIFAYAGAILVPMPCFWICQLLLNWKVLFLRTIPANSAMILTSASGYISLALLWMAFIPSSCGMFV